ncbi:MAG TPA: response regulator [Pyrinomonadaceae bacterium]|nr:response regulator [Pyrinomonadaceae bacterium]
MSETKPKILFVEDVSDTRYLVEYSLQHEGFEVTTVETADAGLECARERGFALILLDIGLPDKDGLQLCREIRAFDTETPILFYTAFAILLDEQEARDAGAQGFLRKPEDTAQLGALVRRFVEGGSEL